MTSNFDRRRINGPEESFAPIFEDDERTEQDQWKVGDPRPGRSSLAIRPICATISRLMQTSWQLTCISDKRSPTTWTNQSSERLSVYRDRADKNCLCCVRPICVSWLLVSPDHVSRKDMGLDNQKTRPIARKVGWMLKSNLRLSRADKDVHRCGWGLFTHQLCARAYMIM